VVATIHFDHDGKRKKVDRVVDGGLVKLIAGQLKLSAREAKQVIGDALVPWVMSNFCGPHNGWFERLLEEIHKRHRAKGFTLNETAEDKARTMREYLKTRPNNPLPKKTIEELRAEDEAFDRLARGLPAKAVTATPAVGEPHVRAVAPPTTDEGGSA